MDRMRLTEIAVVKWRTLPIADAGLSARATRALLSTYADPSTFPPFETIGAVAELSDRELLRWPGVRWRVVEEIRGRVRKLAAQGLE